MKKKNVPNTPEEKAHAEKRDALMKERPQEWNHIQRERQKIRETKTQEALQQTDSQNIIKFEQPIEGIDSMTPEMNDAYDRIQAYTNATHEFTAGDQIARTSEPDYDTAQAAQDFKDKYTFEIAQNLQPSTQSVVNALTTAIPGKLGVYS